MNTDLDSYFSENWKLVVGHIIQDIMRDKTFRSFDVERVTHDKKLKALLASALYKLSMRLQVTDVPQWITCKHTLDVPWFVSGIQNMHAMALLESPIAFKRTLVFVTKEFFMRI